MPCPPYGCAGELDAPDPAASALRSILAPPNEGSTSLRASARRALKGALKRIPPLAALVTARDALRDERDRLLRENEALRERCDVLARDAAELAYWAGPEPRFAPPGHFASPVPSLDDVRAQATRIFGPPPRTIPGIDLDEAGQLALLDELETYYRDLPFGPKRRPGLRYWFDNPAYSYSDGIFLYCMLRRLRPGRFIEVGSGHSSCLTLDVNALHFEGRMRCTFIEPYPDRLLSLLDEADRRSIDLIRKPLQDVPLSTFAELEANDVLFIDSSHVGKAGSDVNYLLFDILPSLDPGVHVHIHDVLHPFEYPLDWLEAGRAFNEAYLVRAFLSFNEAFRVVLFNTFLEHFHERRFAERMPLCLRNTGGSLWLARK